MGVVYRDLKPENVMISYDGHVKLVDFGFAVAVNDDSDTIMGGCGTAMYVAPEIAAKGMKLAHGAPVDWWACGIMMFEMIAGRAPFGDTSDMSKFEVFNNINGGKIKWPSLMKKAAKVRRAQGAERASTVAKEDRREPARSGRLQCILFTPSPLYSHLCVAPSVRTVAPFVHTCVPPRSSSRGCLCRIRASGSR